MNFHLTFESQLYLWLLLLIPVMIILHFYYYHFAKKRAIKFSNFEALKKVSGNTLITKNLTTLLFKSLIIIFVVLSLSGLTIWFESDVSNDSFILLLDSGASMNAIDVEPDRFTLAKEFAMMFVDNVSSKIGFMGFAGTITDSIDLTFEKNEIREKIRNSKITQSGTDMALAISIASEKDARIVLISDGHDTVGLPLSEALEKAMELHRQIITVGVGTVEGGNFITGPSVISAISKLDEKNLMMIANMTNGRYYSLESKSIEEVISGIEYDKTQGFVPFNASLLSLFLAFVFIVIDWILANTRFRILP